MQAQKMHKASAASPQAENPMRKIRIDKVVINIGFAKTPERLEAAVALLKKMTSMEPVVIKAKGRTTFGTSKGKPMGAKATLRGNAASEFLKKAFGAVENKIRLRSFSGGNFSFGIKEYIDIPGMQYDPEIGIIGMDVCVSLERPGYRVKRRHIRSAALGADHEIKREEAAEFMRGQFGITIE
jgi:large subunit ribosomal protein L5